MPMTNGWIVKVWAANGHEKGVLYKAVWWLGKILTTKLSAKNGVAARKFLQLFLVKETQTKPLFLKIIKTGSKKMNRKANSSVEDKTRAMI